MAKIKIPHLRPKGKEPKIRWFWEPSKTLKNAGWQSLPLGTDMDAA